jgi:hypothetical protein
MTLINYHDFIFYFCQFVEKASLPLKHNIYSEEKCSRHGISPLVLQLFKNVPPPADIASLLNGSGIRPEI